MTEEETEIPSGYYILCHITKAQWKQVLEIIATNPNEVRTIDHGGYLPIHFVCSTKATSVPVNVLDALIEAYPESLHTTTKLGTRLPLHCILSSRLSPRLDVVRTILQPYPEALCMRDDAGCTPLHIYLVYCESPSFEVIQKLVEAQPHVVRVGDNDDWVPLHHAAARGHWKLSMYFMELYPEALVLEDSGGSSPRDIAYDNGHHRLCEKLRKEEGKKLRRKRSVGSLDDDRDKWSEGESIVNSTL